MASNMVSDAVTNSPERARELSRMKKNKKKKKSSSSSSKSAMNRDHHHHHRQPTHPHNNNYSNSSSSPSSSSSTPSWKSETQQQVYSSKLLQALRHVRHTSSTGTPKPGRAVREAADRVLAVTAKGKTRWSRAILTNRLKLKFMKKNNNNNNNNNRRHRGVSTASTSNSISTLRSSKKARVSILRLKNKKNMPAVQRKARLLGRLVPGCRKETLPVILEEAGDYIAALEMQVRAMASLADLLSGAASTSSSVSHLGSAHPPTT